MRVTSPENLTRQVPATGIADSWLVRVAGAGHGLMYQFPRELAPVVQLLLGLAPD